MENTIIDEGQFSTYGEKNLPTDSEKYIKNVQGWKLFIAICMLLLGAIYFSMACIILVKTISISLSIMTYIPILILAIVAVLISLPAYFIYISTKKFKTYFQSGTNNDFTIALESDKRFWKTIAIYGIVQMSLTCILFLLNLIA
ncbi:MAG: hypothetical protein HYZ42_18715 [Bacteroidetes bacterium]|nr:hypothetical protein [Bacteroidota bacterium]